MDKLVVVLRIAFRNLFASRLKTLIVGGIIFFGTVLCVVGTSLLDSVDQGMSRSIVGAAAGHIQIYSSKSKDELSIWPMGMGDQDIAALDDFSKVKAVVEKVPNVESVVPMGISGALVTSGNTIDIALSELRDALRKQKEGDTAPEVAAKIDGEKSHVRHILEVLQGDLAKAKAIAKEGAQNPEDVVALAKAASPEFWSGFDADPFGSLEFLENRIAQQATDADLLFLRYIGTDLDSFQKSFDRMQIVDGTRVPEGRRGFLFSKYFYEEFLKLKTARRLDKIKEQLGERGKTIAGDEELKRLVRENKQQTREIVLQLDTVKANEMTARLQKHLGSKESQLETLLATFFDTDDAVFAKRYDAFYAEIAPLLTLYRVRVGDTLTIKSFTKSGYVRSVNVKVYGSFQFKGLEKATLAGSLNLMDLSTFRDLYGFMTSDSAKETEAIKAEAGVKTVARANAEESLFGDEPAAPAAGADAPRVIQAEATPGVVAENPNLKEVGSALRRKEIQSRVYSKEEIEGGAVLNAAVFLKDSQLIPQTMKDIEAAGTAGGLTLKAVSWQNASGFIGQFVMLARVVLFVALFIIFVVVLVIISNALVMATLERVREIGTLRAIGAQKRFVLLMLFIEACVTGLVFGFAGLLTSVTLLGGIINGAYGGIPATTDISYFFFSGPRLVFLLHPGSMLGAMLLVGVVSAMSSFYPAWLAMRVSPVTAMSSEE